MFTVQDYLSYCTQTYNFIQIINLKLSNCIDILNNRDVKINKNIYVKHVYTNQYEDIINLLSEEYLILQEKNNNINLLNAHQIEHKNITDKYFDKKKANDKLKLEYQNTLLKYENNNEIEKNKIINKILDIDINNDKHNVILNNINNKIKLIEEFINKHNNILIEYSLKISIIITDIGVNRAKIYNQLNLKYNKFDIGYPGDYWLNKIIIE